MLAEKTYEVVESGKRATKVLEHLERTTMRLDVAAFREDLRIADEARLRLAEQLELRGILPERTRTRAEERARLLAINHRAKELFPGTRKTTKRKRAKWRQYELGLSARDRQLRARAQTDAAGEKRTKAQRAAWRRETLLLIEQHDRAASLIETYGPFEKHIPKNVLYHDVRSPYERTVNRRFQPMSPLWPSAVSDKSRPPWGTPLRRRWFRTESGPFVEVDVSSSQTQVLAYLLGDTELERMASSQSFNAFLAEQAWRRSRRNYRGKDRFQFRPAVHKDDVYKDADDPRLLALVKQTWMRTLYGSQPWAIVHDQAANVEEYGQGWDSDNLSKFLKAVPGWKTVSMFLKACQAIGRLEEHQCGITMRDPFDRVEFQWAPAWRQPKALSTRGAKRGFTFSIDVPEYDVTTGGFRVEKRKMRDCIAPRTVHMLDAALNALVIEQVATLCRTGAFPLVAVHDAWLMAQIDDAAVDPDVIPLADTTAGEVYKEFTAAVEAAKAAGSDTVTGVKFTHLRAFLEQAIDKNELDAADGPLNVTVVRGAWILRWALDRAAKEWFTSLESVYDDLIRLLAGTEYESFAHGIKATWRKRLDACQGGTAPWPTFRAKTI